MSHFARVENGIVTQVIVAEQDVIDSGLFGDGWIQTSYNTHGGKHPEGRPLRKNFAGIGFSYDAERDAFIPPKPYESFLLNEETCLWEPPVPVPKDQGTIPTSTDENGETISFPPILYFWDEETKNWVKKNGT